MPIFEKAGHEIFFDWAGREDGPCLALSHSLGAAHRLWDRQIEEFGKHFRLLRYDHRGHGQSSRPARPWTIDEFGEDFLGLIDHLELERVHFCGISLGGMVGMWLAENAAERIDQLVVANTAAFTEDPGVLKRRMREIENSGMQSIVEDVLDRWFTPGFHAESPEIVDEFREMVRNTPAESYLATSEAICGLDLRVGLSSTKCPSLVITGRQDQATPPSWGQAIAAEIPGAELRELDAAHLTNVEASAAFNGAVIDFLRR